MYTNMPMRWYKFIKYVTIPLGLIGWGIRVFQSFFNFSIYSGTSLESLFLVDILISVFAMLLIIGAAYGVYKQRWSGIKLLLLEFFVLYINNLITFFIELQYEFIEYSEFLGKFIGSSIVYLPFIYCNYVYFNKRRDYFIGGSYFNRKNVATDAEKIPETTDIKPINSVSSQENAQFGSNLIESNNAKTNGEKVRVRVQRITKNKEPLLSEKNSEQMDELGIKIQKIEKRRSITYIISVVCALLLCSTIVLSFICVRVSNEKSSISKEYEILKTDFDKLQASYQLTKDQLSKKNTQLLEKYDECHELEQINQRFIDERTKLLGESFFLNNAIGFIADGNGYYHNFNCEIYQNADVFWAHNIEYCEFLGYEPCPECIGKDSDNQVVKITPIEKN